jgi:tyrosyl-DNA phosphodiesterase 2
MWVILAACTSAPFLIYLLLRVTLSVDVVKRKQKPHVVPQELANCIPQFHYTHETQSWEKYHNMTKDETFDTCFRIVTFNTLFDLYTSKNSEERYEHQITHLLPFQNADIIALNEVTKHYLSQLLEQEWVRNYYISRFSNKKSYKRNVDVKHFFSVILSRKPFYSLHHYWFHKSIRTKRSAILGTFKRSDGSLFSICTAHLVARPERHQDRYRQLKELFSLLKSKPSLIVGDMNLHYESEEKQLKDVQDLWKIVKPDESGYTFDTQRNSMITMSNARLRLDRMLAVNAGNTFKCDDIRLFGDEPIDQVRKIFPSDHFGLVADISFI